MPYLSDGDRVIRGAWPGQEPQIACVARLSITCFARALIDGGKAVTDLPTHHCCKFDAKLLPETLRLASFFMRLQPHLKAAVLRIKGETETGEQ